MIKHLIKIEGELFEIPLKVYNHLEDSEKYSDELEDMLIVEIEENYRLENKLHSEKQRADELEDRISEEIRKRFQLEDRWRKAYERADELEKRWEKLKEHFIKEKEQSFGMLSWSRNNEVLELIERLEEDDND